MAVKESFFHRKSGGNRREKGVKKEGYIEQKANARGSVLKACSFTWGIWLSASIILIMALCSVIAVQFVKMRYENAVRYMVGSAYQKDAGQAERLLEQLFQETPSEAQNRTEILRQGEEAARKYGYTDAGFGLWSRQVLPVTEMSVLYGAFFILAVFGIFALAWYYRSLAGQMQEKDFACRHLEEQLLQTKKYCLEWEGQLQQFMENIAHQIKMPLTGILMNIELLEEVRTEHDRKLREKSIRQIEKIKKLLMNLLNTARMQAGKIHFHKEKLSLEELVEEVLTEYPMVEFAQQDSLTAEDGAGQYEIRADREWLSEAIENIVANGLVYGPVQMELSAGREQVILRILDRGRGISQTESKKIFERYYVGSGQKNDSTGIGLHLSWMVVHAHGGDILVRVAEEKGTCIEIRLPRYVLKSKI